ncbi:MAG: EscU/YscU/HrcU family type III secretion system export apparatus switch protein [Alphaproteobacteria bacterium]|nr:EscU/YscU/HrcU family type III secretion system export apparatus switch protein [Alphaproteobacteria bacterium]
MPPIFSSKSSTKNPPAAEQAAPARAAGQKALPGPVSADLEIGDPAAPKRRAGRQAAIALEHRRGSDRTPTIVAQGYGKIAEAILTMAFDNDVKVREDPDLAEVLMAVDLGEDIPIEAFAAVAEILSYLYLENLKVGGEEQ